MRVQRTVLVIGGQHLVAGLQGQRAGDDIEPQRDVGHVDQVVGVGADKVAQRLPRLVQQFPGAPLHKLDRLALQFQLPGLVGLKHGARARAKRAVVQKDHARPQQKLVAQAGQPPIHIIHSHIRLCSLCIRE